MAIQSNFKPTWLSSPGDTIKDLLVEQEITVEEFSDILEESEATVHKLLNGKLRITRELAQKLSGSIGGSVTFWRDRETQYRIDQKAASENIDPYDPIEWIKRFPFSDMKKLGWINAGQSKPSINEKVESCLRFFGVSDIPEWEEKYGNVQKVVAFRATEAFETNHAAVAAWIRNAEIKASEFACADWNKSKLETTIVEIRKLIRLKDPSVFIPKIRSLLAECGVAFIVSPTPAGCRASGATKFISKTKALLIVSFRYKTDDHFWFTIFHEIGHLLLHSKDALFVEEKDLIDTHEEDEADAFSKAILIPEEIEEELLRCDLDYKSIIRIAVRAKVSAGVVVGQLQHLGRLRHDQRNNLKVRYSWAASS